MKLIIQVFLSFFLLFDMRSICVMILCAPLSLLLHVQSLLSLSNLSKKKKVYLSLPQYQFRLSLSFLLVPLPRGQAVVLVQYIGLGLTIVDCSEPFEAIVMICVTVWTIPNQQWSWGLMTQCENTCEILHLNIKKYVFF